MLYYYNITVLYYYITTPMLLYYCHYYHIKEVPNLNLRIGKGFLEKVSYEICSVSWRESIFQAKGVCKQVRENMGLSVNKNWINMAEAYSDKSCMGHAEFELPLEHPNRDIQ